MPYTELGNRLTEMLGSQSKIAAVLGITQQAVSLKLAGVTPITVDELQMIARQLCVPMTVFFEKRGTDGAALIDFHAMHMHAPEALDRIAAAFRHNRRTLRLLAKEAARLMKEVEPEIRRSDRIFSAGVDNDVVVAPPPPKPGKETHEGEDDSEAHR